MNKIDNRFEEEEVVLICKECGCVCSTKNIYIYTIGSRSIKPKHTSSIFGLSYLALTVCNEKGHKVEDLRLLTDEEYNEYNEDGNKFVIDRNAPIADQYKEE